MLNKEHLHFRRRNGRITPVFIEPSAPAFLQLAESLLAVYREGAAKGLSRGEIDEMVDPLIKGSSNSALAAAFNKLIIDNARFEAAKELDYPKLRSDLLKLSGILLKQGLSADEYRRTVEVSPEFQAFEGADIYGDLPENERLTGLKNITAQELTCRYNTAQVQGLLFYSGKLSVHLTKPEASELRRLFKYLKFFRLLAEIRRRGEDIYLEISGPFDIFANTRKYALQLASFFPALVLMPRWKMTAEIDCGGKKGQLVLDESANLKSHYRNFSSYVPEEIAMFHRLFREKVTEWSIVGNAPLLDGGEGRVFFPDLSFQNGDGATIHLELFHRWHRTELERRLKLLAEKPSLPLIIGIDRALADDKEYACIQEEYPMLAERMFRFRDFPGVDRVCSCLKKFQF